MGPGRQILIATIMSRLPRSSCCSGSRICSTESHLQRQRQALNRASTLDCHAEWKFMITDCQGANLCHWVCELERLGRDMGCRLQNESSVLGWDVAPNLYSRCRDVISAIRQYRFALPGCAVCLACCRLRLTQPPNQWLKQRDFSEEGT